jgi:hypothetical protein
MTRAVFGPHPFRYFWSVRMMRTTTVCIWTAVVCLSASAASAQTAGATDTKAFVDFNVGGQFLHHPIDSTVSFPLYDETATVSSSQKTANGFVFEIGGGYKFTKSLAGGLSYSGFSSSADATVTATIPHPLFFDQPLTVNTTATGLERSEHDVHLRVIWFMPVSDKIDVALSAGPSFIKLSQQLPSGTVATGTQNLTVTTTTESKNGAGFNLGFDGTYLITPKIGVAAVIHYVHASMDLTSVSGVGAGGVQAGLGLHYRF